MSRHDLPRGGHDGDAIDVRLHRHGLEGMRARHAVRDVVEPDGLIFVNLRGRGETGVEGPLGQRNRRSAVALEARRDNVGLAGSDPSLVVFAASPQMLIEFDEITSTRHRRGPSPFQILDPVLDMRLLVAAGRHAEQGLEVVMAGQGLVAIVEPSLATFEHLHGHGRWVVPPEFLWHAAEERKSFDQAVEDRFGALGGQGDREDAIRKRPGDDQDRDKPAAVREIDVDVAKVGLGSLAGVVVQGDERLTFTASHRADMASDLVVSALVPVLGDKATMNLSRGVSLFARRLLVRDEDLVNHGFEGIELGRGRWLCSGVGLGLGVLEGLANRASCVVEGPSDGPETHAVTMRPSNLCVIVHSEHP